MYKIDEHWPTQRPVRIMQVKTQRFRNFKYVSLLGEKETVQMGKQAS